MINLNRFRTYQLSDQAISKVKGGLSFCEILINHRNGKNVPPGQMAIAMELDAQLASSSLATVAATPEGAAFIAKYG